MKDSEYQTEVDDLIAELYPYDKGEWPDTVAQIEAQLDRLYGAHVSDLADASSRRYVSVRHDISTQLWRRKGEKDEIADALAAVGFSSTIGTGGGCQAYYLELTPPNYWPHFLVTDDNCGLPEFWDEEGVIGYYPEEDSNGDAESYHTVRELLELLKQGKGHPDWTAHGLPQKSTAVATPWAPQADLDVINRHRRILGMPPLDESMGWTEKELVDMAHSIRTTGKMMNPAQASLKRKLMR